MNKKEAPLFVLIFIFLAAWIIFIQFIGSSGAIELLYRYQVDKAVHFLGGFVVMGVLFRLVGIRVRSSLLLLLVTAILWEVFELLVLPDVIDLYQRNFELWRNDTIGDLILGMVGGILAFIAYRDPK